MALRDINTSPQMGRSFFVNQSMQGRGLEPIDEVTRDKFTPNIGFGPRAHQATALMNKTGPNFMRSFGNFEATQTQSDEGMTPQLKKFRQESSANEVNS